MRLSLRLAGALACASIFFACAKADPDKAETWFKALSSSQLNVQKNALNELRRIGDRAAVPAILPLLQEDGEIRAEAAKVLGRLGDAAAVPALIEAIDLKVGTGSDKASRDANNANKEIAEALGALGDKSAVEPLMKLTNESRDAFVKVASINSLGILGDSRAVEGLSNIATSNSEEPFVSKKAVQALGVIADPAAVPAITKMLFYERKGVSFYKEASLSAYQVGPPAAGPLLTVLEGKDEELNTWAEKNDIYLEALYIKAAQVLSDLDEQKAIPELIKKATYVRPGTSPNAIDPMVLLTRRNAALALGRLNAPEAVPALVRGLDEDEGNIRNDFAQALVQIGDERALAPLAACALKGPLMDKAAHARKGCYDALSLLGNAKTKEQWDSWMKAEPELSSKACMRGLTYDSKSKANAQAHCDALAASVVKFLEAGKPRLDAAVECGKEIECWTGKLKDEEASVRQRAALELGRLEATQAIEPLMAALSDSNDVVRLAAILTVDRLASASKEALAAARKGLPALEKQIDEEKDKVHTARVNEDLVRLAMKIHRLERDG